MVYVSDAARVQSPAVKAAICSHIAELVIAVFLNSRPATPAQSRWTGVPSIARFGYGLFAFHGLLGVLCKALMPKGQERPGGQERQQDLDVLFSECRFAPYPRPKKLTVEDSRMFLHRCPFSGAIG